MQQMVLMQQQHSAMLQAVLQRPPATHNAANKPQRFSGKAKSTTFSAWITSILTYFAAANVPDANRVDIACTYLEEVPRTAWDSILASLVSGGAVLEQVNKDWDIFVSRMSARFAEPAVQYSARLELLKLKCGFGSIVEYSQKFTAIGQRVPHGQPGSISDAEAIFFYLNGLPERFQQAMMVDPTTNRYWESFERLQTHAATMGAAFVHAANAGSSSSQSQPRKKVRRGSGRSGNLPASYAAAVSTVAQPTTPYQQVAMQPVQPIMQAMPVAAAAYQPHVVCHHCGQAGHIRPQCPLLAHGAVAGRGRGRGRGLSFGQGRGRAIGAALTVDHDPMIE